MQKAGIDGLLLQLVVDFFGALAFQDDRGNPGRPVPGGEIGNGGVAGKRKNVVPFLDAAGVVGKHLAHEDAGIPVVDANGDFHFFERKDRGIRLLLVARYENARVSKQQGRSQQAR